MNKLDDIFLEFEDEEDVTANFILLHRQGSLAAGQVNPHHLAVDGLVGGVIG